MNDYIQELLKGRQYHEELKEEAIFRVLFGGEDVHAVKESLNISDTTTINNWVNLFRRKIESGLISIAPMSKKQQQDLAVLQQRIKELERCIKDANLMILALNTMIDVAEQDLKIPIRKKRGTKRS